MASIPRWPASVNNFVQPLFFELQVGNVHGPDRMQRGIHGFGGGPVRTAQLAMKLPQRAQHPRAIEPLSLAVLAEAHRATPPVLYKRARRRRRLGFNRLRPIISAARRRGRTRPRARRMARAGDPAGTHVADLVTLPGYSSAAGAFFARDFRGR